MFKSVLDINEFKYLKDILEKDSGEKLNIREDFGRIFIEGTESELMLRFFKHTNTIIIARIRVKNQRTGIASSILEWLKDYAKKNNYNNIKLESTLTAEINGFAKKHNFKPVEHKGSYFEGMFYGDWNLELD